MRGLSLGREQLYVTYESPFVYVDTEVHVNNALARGRSMVLRGEGTGGVITLTGEKTLSARGMSVIGATGGEELRFANNADLDAHVFIIDADDITLADFLFTSTTPLGVGNLQIGIYFPVGADQSLQRGHRTYVRNVEMSNWTLCMAKHGGLTSPILYDVVVDRCYWHSCKDGGYMTYGIHRMKLLDCRFLMKLQGETHDTGNALTTSANVVDLTIIGGVYGQCDLMGLELTNVPDGENLRPHLSNVRVKDTGSFGVSFGHCVNGFADRVRVSNATAIGFEVGGSAGRLADAHLVNCEVDGCDAPADCAAYTLDHADDSIIDNCRALNIASDTINLSMGVYVYQSERTQVSGSLFKDAGAVGIHYFKGTGSNATGFHLAQGNTFRHTANIASQRAVYVSDTNVVVRNNTSFEKSGWNMKYEANCGAGAAVECESGSPVITGLFTGSNKIITVP